MLCCLHPQSHLGFAGGALGQGRGLIQSHICLAELEEAMAGKSWLQYRPPLQSQISFQVAVALQKWHGMCWGCVCVTELASKGQLQWKRGISLLCSLWR